MQISPLLLLSAATIALALPTNNTTDDASILSKRASKPWLQSFPLDDVVCTPTHEDDAEENYRPFITAGTCVAYQPEDDRVGGSWGSVWDALNNFSAYEYDDCTGPVKAMITRKNDEPGFCFELEEYLGCQSGGDLDNPCFWNSVMGHK